MNFDLAAVAPTVVVALIGWLIRQSFSRFSDKLDLVVSDVKGLRDDQERDGNRITALETVAELRRRQRPR